MIRLLFLISQLIFFQRSDGELREANMLPRKLDRRIAAGNSSHHHHAHLFPSLDHQKYFTMYAPNNTLLADGMNVFGSVVVSDIGPLSPLAILANQSIDSHNVSAEIMEKYSAIIPRIRNIQAIESELPFPLTKWNAVYTTPCPLFPHSHPTERGLSFAHYRIWKDFVYFDPILLHEYERYLHWKNTSNASNETTLPGHHNWTSSALTRLIGHDLVSLDHQYKIDLSTGQRYKHHTPIQEGDRMVIFEEDAINTIVDLSGTMSEELSDMTDIDVLYLGWCEGRTARPVPLCSHAYVVTRSSARKLIQYFEPCGRGVDEQFVVMIKNHWLTYRRAHGYSYSRNRKASYECWGDKTYGIFHQCKHLYGSVNNHR